MITTTNKGNVKKAAAEYQMPLQKTPSWAAHFTYWKSNHPDLKVRKSTELLQVSKLAPVSN
jgi:hypothetical protein